MRKFAILLLAAPLALAACGSSSEVQADPVAYVKHAAVKTADLKSEHMELTGTIDAGSQTISLQGSGDFANHPAKGSSTLSMSGAGQSFGMKEVEAGNTVYVSFPALMEHLGSNKTWAKVDLAQLSKATHLSFLSQDPAQYFAQLEAAGSVKSLGTETVDGTETTRYQIPNLDLSKLPQVARLAAQAHTKVGIDVWIGKSDGYVYRESVTVTASEGHQSATFTGRVDFSKFNEPVTVNVPPASETFDMSHLANLGAGA